MYLLPLVSTLFSGIFSTFARFYGQRGASVLSIVCMFISFVSSVLIWYEVVFGGSEVYFDVFGTWFTVGTLNVYWSLYIDLIAVHLLLTVTSVSFAVHCYALVYMKGDPHLNLFMGYLSFFTFFMCLLVTGQDLVVMLVGWEGYKLHSLNDTILDLLDDYIFDLNAFTPFNYACPANKRLGPHTSLFKQILTGRRWLYGIAWTGC